MVGEEYTVKVINLMLQHTGNISFKPFVMRFKFFVYILYPYARVPSNLLVNAR